MKIRDPKTGEEREETDEEKKARESGGGKRRDVDEDDIESVREDRDHWKQMARKWEDRVKEKVKPFGYAGWDEVEKALGRLKDIEDKSKSDSEKATEAVTQAKAAETAARVEAMRLRVALRKGLTDTQAKRLVGETEEELESDADELIKTFKGDTGDEEQEPPTTKGPTRVPKERLRPGAKPPATEPPVDTKKVVDEVMERTGVTIG